MAPPAKVILIVDDEEQVRRALRRTLGDMAGVVVEAEDPIQAMLVAIPRYGLPALVISDYRMPGMSGLEFLRHLAEHQPGIRRMLVTGGASSREPEALFAETPRGTVCFPKPWDVPGRPNLFQDTVRALLGDDGDDALPDDVFVKQ